MNKVTFSKSIEAQFIEDKSIISNPEVVRRLSKSKKVIVTLVTTSKSTVAEITLDDGRVVRTSRIEDVDFDGGDIVVINTLNSKYAFSVKKISELKKISG